MVLIIETRCIAKASRVENDPKNRTRVNLESLDVKLDGIGRKISSACGNDGSLVIFVIFSKQR